MRGEALEKQVCLMVVPGILETLREQFPKRIKNKLSRQSKISYKILWKPDSTVNLYVVRQNDVLLKIPIYLETLPTESMKSKS